MNRITTLGLVLGFAFAAAGTASAQVKLAVGGPITGPSAATGAQMKNGVDQAAAELRQLDNDRADAGQAIGPLPAVTHGESGSASHRAAVFVAIEVDLAKRRLKR